jgi:hypothetical protein
MKKRSILLVLLLVVISGSLSAQKNVSSKDGSKGKTSGSTPCMDVLSLFTAPNVPAFGPGE